MAFVVAQANRLGNRASNQDRCLIAERGDTVLLALADGMGGHARGDLAAQAFVDTLDRRFRTYQGLEDPGQFLRDAFRDAHRTILRVGQAQNPPIQPMTTGVACLIQDGVAVWAHVGDSRAYLIRMGQIALRTRDHTRVAEMVEAGLLTEQQARLHPLRNHVSLCLGGTERPPPVTLGPKIYLAPDDLVLLCSDGLWSPVPESRLVTSLENGPLAETLELLAENAERASYPQSDNVSAVALRWETQVADTHPSAASPDGDIDPTSKDPAGNPLDRAIADIHEALAEYAHEMHTKP